MKYSDKYEVTTTATVNNVTVNCTDYLKNIYVSNDNFDNSIIYTSSDILDSLNLYKTTANRNVSDVLENNRTIKPTEPNECKIGVSFGIENTRNIHNRYKYQFGVGENTSAYYNTNEERFVKNISISNIIFKFVGNIGGKAGANISDIVNSTDESKYTVYDQFDIYAYMKDASDTWKSICINPVICIYDNEKITGIFSISEIIKLSRYQFIYYRDFKTYFYTNNVNTEIRSYDNLSNYYILSNDFINENVDLQGYSSSSKILYENDFIMINDVANNSSISTVSTKLKTKFLSKILASLGVMFTDADIENTKTSVDTLIANGHIWLGKMEDNGRSTGDWIHTVKDIYKSYNFDITTENEKYNPNNDDDDKDEIAIQTVGVGQQEAKFLKYYLMSSSDLETLSNDMDETIVSNPIQYIISLQEISSIVVPYLSPITNIENIHLGSWVSPNATGLRINSSTGILFAGSTRIDRVFNNFLDYSPYTILNLYVPFCGTVELPTDVAMGKEVSVNITFDMDTFDCCAMIFIDGGYFAQINGNLSKNYSVTQSNFGLHKLQVAGSMASVVANLGAIAFNPVSALALPSTIGGMVNTFAKSFTTLKGGNSDYNDFKTPCFCCLFRSIPRLEDLTGFRKSVGIRCEKYEKLSEFHGFTVCRNPHINISATEEEKEMLYELLSNGVILP